MESIQIIDYAREGVWVLMLVGAPMMLTAMFVGLIISFLQALTQIQETTLTFVPKMIAMLVVMVISLPYMLQTLQEYGVKLFDQIATIE
jgi:flagellar biosynthetic protein FliQ